MYKEIETLLYELKLSGMLQIFNEPNLKDISDDFYNLLKNMLIAEKQERQIRSLRYHLKLSKIPVVKHLDNFNWENYKSLKNKIEYLSNGQFIIEHNNIIFIGGPGSGKTHLSLALAYKAICNNNRVRFYNFRLLIEELLESEKTNNLARFIEWLKRFDCIVMDEFGYLSISNQITGLLFRLFSELYERTSIIITTHLSFDEWGKLFIDEKLAATIIDRITHHCYIFETGNSSQRLNENMNKNMNENINKNEAQIEVNRDINV